MTQANFSVEKRVKAKNINVLLNIMVILGMIGWKLAFDMVVTEQVVIYIRCGIESWLCSLSENFAKDKPWEISSDL